MLSWCWLRWLRSPINDCAAALTCPTQLSDGPWLPKSWRSAPDGGSGRLASLVEFQCSTSCLSFCSTFFLYQLVLTMNMSPHHLICSGMLNGWIHLRYINAFCALKLELDSCEPKYVLSMAANPKRFGLFCDDEVSSGFLFVHLVQLLKLRILCNLCMPSYNDC